MNLAIILSVSEYTDSMNNLPGCKKDADCINNIITKTSKFDEILFTDVSQLKMKLIIRG